MADPKPGSPEWQAELDRQIAEHDAKAKASGDPNQDFEIAPPTSDR